MGLVPTTDRLDTETVCLVDVFDIQVRPRETHIQRLNLAVWVFNCIVARVPHLRQRQMNAETQYLVSGCSIPSKPIPQPVSAERGHRLGVTRKTVKMKSVSFQLWVIEENILLELQGKTSAFYFCLKLNQTRLHVPDTQVLDE